ncbi:MAG: glycosyltransferase family A protein [Candidatus Methylacidiphilales bacterium]|nr:glycosyltransferase family A protein [Candidatus Methylacidiphilales bacterium]
MHPIDAPSSDVTVVIPTTDRPDFLRTALQSVAAQSARPRIRRVLISENRTPARTRSVAGEFSRELPIDFVSHTTPLPPLEHLFYLMDNLEQDGSMAMLHDDDWWMPHHLESALARIGTGCGPSSTYSGYLEARSESSPFGCGSNLMLWFGAGFPDTRHDWNLPKTDMILASLWGTPVRYSTLVAHTDSIRRIMPALRRANPFDNDRLLGVCLAAVGNLTYSPTPSVCIRLHPGQDTHRYDALEQSQNFSQTTHHLLDMLDDPSGFVLLLADRLTNCPDHSIHQILPLLAEPWCYGPLLGRGLLPKDIQALVLPYVPKKPNFFYHLGRLLPPILKDWIARARSKSGKPSRRPPKSQPTPS